MARLGVVKRPLRRERGTAPATPVVEGARQTVARKAGVQAPAQRRSGVNRAQLKALAAQQAMANAPARPARRAVEDEEMVENGPDLGNVAANRRRAFLSREQEYAYIRADLTRLLIVSAVLLVVLVAILFFLNRFS